MSECCQRALGRRQLQAVVYKYSVLPLSIRSTLASVANVDTGGRLDLCTSALCVIVSNVKNAVFRIEPTLSI